MLATSRRSTTRRAGVALLVWAGLWLASLTVATPVDAHATLLRSDPTTDRSYTSGPQSITLWFSEQIETEYSRIDVLRRDGSRVLAGELTALNDGPDPGLRLTLSEPLPEGAYTVVWSTLSSVDSHVSEGYFSFAVGDVILPSPSEEAELAASAASDKVIPQFVDAAIRWLSLLGQASIAGVLLFAPVVLMPVLRDGEGRRLPIPAGRFRRLLFASLALLAVGHLAAAVVQIMNATRSADLSVLGDPLISLLSGTRYGALWLSRSVLIVALAVLLWLLTRGRRLMTTGGQGRVVWIWAGWIAALVLLTTSLGSHAAARGGAQSLPVALDWLHLAGTSIWTGGLFALLLSLPLAAAAGVATRRRLIQRFSVVALIAFAVLAITGTIAAVREVDSIDGLTSTDYGLWFTAKLVVVAGAVGFGAWHWLVVRPALESGQEPVVAQAERGFRRTLPVEAGLVILAVAATGLLTSSIPARDLLNTGPPTFGTTRLMSEASITLRATPGEVGTNEFAVVVGPVDADTFGDLESIDLRFEPVGTSGSSQQIQLEQASPNDPWTYRGNGDLLSRAGDWQVTAIIRRVGDAAELEAPFALTADSSGLRPTGVPAPASDDGLNSEALVLAGAWLLGALTLATAAFLMRRRERTTLSFSLLTLSVLAAAMGSVLLLAGGIVA